MECVYLSRLSEALFFLDLIVNQCYKIYSFCFGVYTDVVISFRLFEPPTCTYTHAISDDTATDLFSTTVKHMPGSVTSKQVK